MTNGYSCDFCDGAQPAKLLITSLVNGNTVSVCTEDLPVTLIPLLAGELGLDPGRLYDVIRRFASREAAREAREAAKAGEDTEVTQKCPWCETWIHGSPDDIDSGLRKHMEYCEAAPAGDETS